MPTDCALNTAMVKEVILQLREKLHETNGTVIKLSKFTSEMGFGSTSSRSNESLTMEIFLSLLILHMRPRLQENGQCVLPSEDWVYITGSDKDNSIPSWLQLAYSQLKGVHLNNLPGNATAQRLETLFEMEADCNIDEVFLVKVGQLERCVLLRWKHNSVTHSTGDHS